MSVRQLNHLDTLRRVERHELLQKEAASILKLTDRTVRRQLKRLKKEGPSFLRHGLKGELSNNRLPEKEEKRIGELLKKKYPDFGPTFAAEKLLEIHGINHDPKTIGRIRVSLGLQDEAKKRKKIVHRKFRQRRPVFGELVQFDGSYHNWLEGRGGIDELCLQLAVDDATGKIIHGRFEFHEGVLPTMGFWLEYAGIWGLPKAVYLDRFSTYSMNVKLAQENPDTLTQFERAAKETGIEVIHAYSAEAKGRVERAFKTLQDRLVKEMRLANITSREEANQFMVKTFIPDYNRRFAIEARAKGDLHRIPSKTELNDILPYIFCRQKTRTVLNDFTISYDTKWLQLLPTPRLAIRPREKVEVHELPDKSLCVFVRGKKANIHLLPEKPTSRLRHKTAQTLTT